MPNNGGFTLGGVTANSLGVLMLRTSKRPFIPGTDDATAAIAGRNGSFDFGAKLNPAIFELDCAINKTDPASLQAAADSLAAHLVGVDGKPRTMELIFDLRPDKKYIVRYSGAIDFNREVGLGKFTLPLIAYDPTAYSTTEMTAARTNAGTLAISNGGKLEVWPVIEIVGSFTTLALEIGGPTLVYNEAIASQTLTIDNEKLQAKIGATNKNNKVSGDWLKLAPGANTLTVGGTGLACTVTVSFNAKYL